jgi:two-component system, cell cycle response regulator
MNKEYYETVKGNILIVDDSPENLRLLSSSLVKQGYRVNCVADGEMALHAIRGKLPDLIVLDVLIPIIDGYKVCQILKTNDKTRHIPVVFISSLDSEGDKVQAFQLGAVDYITKPFFVEEVLIRIKTQLEVIEKEKLWQKTVQEQIRERKIVEQELIQSRALLAGVLNSSLDGVAAFEAVRDRWGKIIDFRWLVANPMATMTVGETRESLEGKLLFEKLDLTGHLFEGLFELFVQVVENCTVLNKEHYFTIDRTWFHIVAVKLGDGFAMTFRDISEHKQMEITLKEVNGELQRQANIDSLTQIANRRRFDEYLAQEWSRCTREQEHLSLILCDVDYFKLYNDAYGHQAGDRCLYEVAQAMNLIVKRPADVVFRYGGEEFAVILPFTKGEGALKVAQAIREEIIELKIPHDLSQVSHHITLSLGVSSIIPHPNSHPDSLIETADRALYEAKALGRDQTVYKVLELPLG